jgi:hypothetical protein
MTRCCKTPPHADSNADVTAATLTRVPVPSLKSSAMRRCSTAP